MRVENPEFDAMGIVKGCHNCPLDQGEDDGPCVMWWYRKGAADDLVCPTADTYEEACLMAEEAAKGGKG